MIKNNRVWREFERGLVRAEKPDLRRNFMIVEALYKEAIGLGVLPTVDPLEGIEVKIRLAKAFHALPKAPRPHRRRPLQA